MPRWKRFVIEMSKDGIEKRSGFCIGKPSISRISKLVSQRDVVTFVCLTIVVEEESPCVKELEIVDLVQIWFVWLKNFNTPSRSAIAVWIRCYQPMMIRLNLISLLIGTLLLSMSNMVAPLELRGQRFKSRLDVCVIGMVRFEEGLLVQDFEGNLKGTHCWVNLASCACPEEPWVITCNTITNTFDADASFRFNLCVWHLQNLIKCTMQLHHFNFVSKTSINHCYSCLSLTLMPTDSRSVIEGANWFWIHHWRLFCHWVLPNN